MKNKRIILAVLLAVAVLAGFSGQQTDSVKDSIRQYYHAQFFILSQKMKALETTVDTGASEQIIQEKFRQARLTYKRLELFIEYYLELDAPRFNGLSIGYIEEEDPDALQEPQGFQMIESFIFPHYDTAQKQALQFFVAKLLALTEGIGNNQKLFNPDEFIFDATMEELYRIVALGVSGFDSPAAQYSIPEAGEAMASVGYILQCYQKDMQLKSIKGYDSARQLIENAVRYTQRHSGFNGFNRMVFVKNYLNPLCTWLNAARQKMGYRENPARYALIKKNGHLFSRENLSLNTYLGDDTSTQARIVLGKKLFYEPLLSGNGKRSCAGCHQPGKAFTDGMPTALGLDEHTALPRNTPTLWNAALQRNLFYDSRQASLDQLITEVLSNEKEMNSSSEKAIEKIIQQAAYIPLYKKAYPTADTAMTGKRIVNALAMYVRTLVSYDSRFDQYMRDEGKSLTTTEIKGFNLFMGKAKCGTCHYAPVFNGSKPPTYYYQESEVLGVPATADPEHPVLDKDPGRIAFLKRDFFNHAFKTPTLRNIELTAPYMHNGVYKTLEEVIDFYNKGGGRGLGLNVPNQTLPGDKLQLSRAEKKQLKAFLLTLTDTSGLQQ